MKLWVLVGLLSTAGIPAAFASDEAAGCDVDDTRAVLQLVEESSAQIPAVAARPVTAPPREVADTNTSANAPSNVAPPAPTTDQTPRRRGGSRKRIPDAMLIGPRGAL